MSLRFALSVIALLLAISSCRRDPPPVEPDGGSGGAPVATSASSAGGATAATSSASGDAGDGCIVPAPAPVSCEYPSDCYHGDLCATFVCDPAGHCLYRARQPDRPGGVVGCDPGGSAPGYWSCQGADPTSTTAPGGRCCPDAAPLSAPTADTLPHVRRR